MTNSRPWRPIGISMGSTIAVYPSWPDVVESASTYPAENAERHRGCHG